jgi:5-methylcytosine-specific restriction endonuclease McrA
VSGGTVPIRESEKARYPKDWPAISRRIRERDGQRCKWCGVPNGVTITRHDGGWTEHVCGTTCLGEPCPPGTVLIVLTVAHLDHTPENCADDNLAALCQRCHNRYDAPNRRAGIAERKGVLSLFSGLSRGD